MIHVTAPNIAVAEWHLKRDGDEFWFRSVFDHPYDIAAYTCYRLIRGEWVAVDSCIQEFRN